MFLLVSCGNIGVPERDSNMGVWKSRKPESGKGTGIETGTGTGIGTVIKRGTYIKTGTTSIIIYVNLDLILIQIYTKNKGKKGIETVYRNMRRKGYND